MRKCVAVLLLCISLLVAGCNIDQSNTEPVDTQLSGLVPTQPENPGNSLIEYDPEREVYFTLGNWYYDVYLYTSWRPYLQFQILSKEPIDEAAVSVELPINSSYTVDYIWNVNDGEMYRNTPYTVKYEPGVTTENIDFYSPQLFQAYLGTGWPMEDEDEALAVEEAYKRLEVEDLPQIYEYTVRVHLDTNIKEEESFTHIDIKIGENTYHEEIGLVRIYPKAPLKYNLEWEIPELTSFTTQGGNGHRYAAAPYNDGLFRMRDVFSFVAPFDMTVEDIELFSQDIQLVCAEVEAGGMSFIWDGKEYFDIKKGDKVKISCIVESEHLEAICYQGRVSVGLNYVYPDGSATKLTDSYIFMEDGIGLNELYAIVFDGIDMESYYRNVYYPVREDWREDYQ